jgi:hypothetical protein
MRSIITLLLSLNIYASTISAKLEYFTKHGEKQTVDELQLKDNKLYINNREMNKYQMNLNHDELRVIFSEYNVKKSECIVGKYNFKKSKGIDTTVEKGCVNSLRFKALKKAFKQIHESTPLIKIK